MSTEVVCTFLETQ